MTLKITILGCGSSGGVPRVGSGWGACDPNEPRNRRRRCSILVERLGPAGATTVLVDTGPDLREQLLDAKVERLDGVLLTHNHADHTHGVDDLRPLVIHMRRRVAVHAEGETYASMQDRFGYCFTAPRGSEYPPIATLHRFHALEPVTVEGPGGPVTAIGFPVEHGANYLALAFRFRNIVYCPDIKDIPEISSRLFDDCDLIILDALRETSHPTHLNVAEALALIERVKPQRAVLTNLHTDLDYRTLKAKLPAHVDVAYDGMTLFGEA